ncbi:unnamed protein product [Rotaria sordida]|uniref:HAT C-terminal dimerisation domain-containing protein n=1 Tax=Rotaria sordida TaxID=392033 RepID=A0A819VCX7_9BILA|nr:unnamed protein product [Rotaria sordida]
MPGNLTKFNTDWLHRVDSNNDSVNIWLKKGSTPTTFKCSLCQTGDLSCGNQGWKAIEQHMNINKHKEILRQWKQNAKFRVANQTRSDPADSFTSTSIGIPILDTNTNKNKPLALDDQVTKAEILWSLKVAQKGLSYNLCNELNELFSSMFPDSSIAGNFSIQADKMSYVVSHGLGPYFKKKLIEDVKKPDKFVLIFDEQTNNQNKKQLDMLLRYWSNEKQCVVNRFYKSIILLGHAYAKTIRDIIIESFATDGLNLNKLLMLGRDNPNINISLENLIDVEIKKQGGCLLTIGSCNIHIIHNAFKNGILSSKCEDIDSVMEKAILYFSITRWVLLGKVIDRILNQWDILCDYFLCFLPEKQPVQIRENKRYESIKLVLSSNFSKVKFNFMLYLCENIFDRFLTFFQREEPLIHLLYCELNDLYQNVLLSFLKSDSVQQKSGQDLLNINFEQSALWIADKEIKIGEQTRKLIRSLNFDEKKSFYRDVRKIYITIANYLKKNLPLNNMLLRDLQVLDYLSRTDRSSGDRIVRVARNIPNLLDDGEIDKLANEWALYSVELVDRSWYIKDEYVDSNGNNQIKYHSIDYYWNNVFSILTMNGISKYPTLTKLIKNVLIITHGNADVERGFSINWNILRENRSSLSESSINGLRLVYDGVKFFGSGSAHKVPITTDIINMVKKSSSNYRESLIAAKLAVAIHKNNENSNKIIQNEKQQHLDEEKVLLDKQKTLAHQMKEAEYLIDEGTNRLEGALKSGVFSEVHAAKLLIAGGREKLTSINEQQQQLTNELDKLRLKRKNAFLHEQSINKKLKPIQQNQHNIMDLIDNI